MMSKLNSDVVIVGGGMAGLTMAAMLAEYTPFSIIVLEAKPQFSVWNASQYDHRVSAFAVSSQRIFKSIGVWKSLLDKRVSPFQRIEVWDKEQQGRISFDAHEVAEPVLGYIIENSLVESVLLERLRTYSNVQLYTEASLQTLSNHPSDALLTLQDGSQIETRLVIAADGGHSWVRQAVGISVHAHDYHQQGLVAMVTTEKPHQQIARQHFLSTGPLAFLPLQDSHQCSIVWTLPEALAETYQAMPQDEFMRILERAFSKQLGEIKHCSMRFLFPLAYRYVDQYVKNRVVLIGDAAHTIHPLAGQGINMGLLDAALLASILSEAKFDLSNKIQRYLRQYERARKADNAKMLKGVHALQRLFLSEVAIVQKIRSLGLDMTNQCAWLKHQFIRHAIGDILQNLKATIEGK